MAAGFISKWTAGLWTYFMKALHHWLPVAMHKQFYDKRYPSVLLDAYAAVWSVHSGLAHFSLGVLQLLSTCVFNVLVSTALYKDFVFKDWFCESVSVFKDSRIASQNIVTFVRKFSLAFWKDIWLVCTKHCTFMEKNGLIPCDRSTPVLISGLSLRLSSGMTQLLGIAEAIGVGFGFRKSCLFFSGIGGEVSVHIGA
ncbi:hypothetical protein G9A89_014978 [Geosiphon pyriformis]|nr:hypothetical protein G9A89_014978 [Geosiphon pyriformis]